LGLTKPKGEHLSFLKNKKTGKKFFLTQKIGSSWMTIGTRIGIESDILTSISEGKDNEKALSEVLRKWLSNAGGYPNHEEYPLSWQGLYNLLEDSGRVEDAKQYFEFLEGM
jgi:hypothetical protein